MGKLSKLRDSVELALAKLVLMPKDQAEEYEDDQGEEDESESFDEDVTEP